MVASSNGVSTPAWCLHQLCLLLLRAAYIKQTHRGMQRLKTKKVQANYALSIGYRRLLAKTRSTLLEDFLTCKSWKYTEILKCEYWLCFSWTNGTEARNKQCWCAAHNKQARQMTTRCCCGGIPVMMWVWYGEAMRGIKEGQSKHTPHSKAAR